MKKNKIQIREFHSINEVEKVYLPITYAKKMEEKKDAQAIGIVLAQDALKKIKKELSSV